MAEIDALGRAFGEARRAELGAAAAFDRRDVRAGDRGAGDRAFRDRRHRAGDMTHGHRFMAPAPIKVRRFDDYVAKLEAAKVVLDPAAPRKDMILADAKNLAFAQGLELVEDEGLLEEVAGLVEWPVVLMGGFEEAFLIPGEVIRATIRTNQKCFVVRDPKTGRSSPTSSS